MSGEPVEPAEPVGPVGPVENALQYERTSLAHVRTMLATIVVGLLIVRQSDPGADRVIALVGALGALVAIGVVGFRRQAALQRGDTTALRPAAVAAIAVALLTLQLVAVVIVV
ncbi:MAG: DUF202 domain-containing protein [Ilumatobacteraceae bacterium]